MTATPSRPPEPARNARLAAEKAGRRAEWLCALWLRLCGYRILARRHRSPAGEIDIIARKNTFLIGVEVKHRPSHEQAISALRPAQLTRIANALAVYGGKIGHRGDLRIDLMAVAPRLRIRHIKNITQQ